MRSVALLTAALLLAACSAQTPPQLVPPQGKWLSLFNGNDLSGWVVKIAGHPLQDNYANTFRVHDHLLTVAYDQYDRFDERFGSLTYQQKFSRYWLRVEYRFVGEPAPGSPSWAVRDSGVQLHGQDPRSMMLNQQFPVSVEFNFLGGGWLRSRPTGDVCTNGTQVLIDGQPLQHKCGNTSSVTTRGATWVTALAEVRGNEVIRHGVNGVLVAEYTRPTLNDQDADARRLLTQGTRSLLSEGYISLQSNGHPIEFRRIELLPID